MSIYHFIRSVHHGGRHRARRSSIVIGNIVFFKTPLNQEKPSPKVYKSSIQLFVHIHSNPLEPRIYQIYIYISDTRYRLYRNVVFLSRFNANENFIHSHRRGLYIQGEGRGACFTRGLSLSRREKKWSGAVPGQGKIMHKSRGLFTTAAAAARQQRIIK